MKIQKKYQGAIPLNRIANEYNESEINTYSTQYLNNKFEGNSSMGSVIVEDISCKNLFKLTENRTNYLCTSSISGNTLIMTSTDSAKAGYTNCNYMTFKQGKTYTISFEYTGDFQFMRLFSNDYTIYNDMVTNKNKFTFTMSETKSLSIGFYINAGGAATISNIQVEEGSVATDYIEHKEISNMQFYSKAEQKIGTWIDGKPLYRKVIETTVPDTTANGTFAIKTTSIGSDIDFSMLEFIYLIDTTGSSVPMNYTTNAGYDVKAYITSDDYLTITNAVYNFNSCKVIASILYTKTTD